MLAKRQISWGRQMACGDKVMGHYDSPRSVGKMDGKDDSVGQA